jgi:hypothetical protein
MQRQTFTRILFLVGLILLIVALAGAALLAVRSYPRQTLEDSIGGEELTPPTVTPTSTPPLTSRLVDLGPA